MRTVLHHGWTLRAVSPVPDPVADQVVSATVPGCVHTDLLAAGLIDDPYLDDAERRLGWIGRADWTYETTFNAAEIAADRHDLVFDGLDTVATVALNGVEVVRTANMHRTYRVDVREALRRGPNRLSVRFDSAVRYADRMSLEMGARPHVNHHPYNAIRKMACNFGWDWGPDLVTAGIWRPVALESWSLARLASVRPLATVEGGRGRVAVHVDLEHAGGPQERLEVRAQVGDVTGSAVVEPGATSVVVEVVLGDVELWWPRGHGGQPLYDVVVDLMRVPSSSGAQGLDSWTGRVGFRTVVLRMDPDEEGTSFELHVNDRPVFVKGANWIPDDAFPHRVTRERCAQRVDQAVEAGINLLRVWGGGVFESDDFYDVCDERGVMTWQDFLFACAAYSEEEPLRAEVVAEARDNITRLAPHPSLVMWNGCNENIWGHADWEWQARLDGRTWGMGYYTDVLPALVAELDPHRPYSAGSPWSPSPQHHPNDPDHGTMHVWDVWNDEDWTVYRDHRPRFAAEFGWQGPPTWSTLRRSVSDDPLTPESPGMLVHQKADQGNDKLTRGLVPHLPVPDDMDDWHWAMSLNQARAVQVAVEHFRSLAPRCAGSVVWQLNDCWPVTSWAAVDGDGRRKPLLYALRHAHADRLLTVQPRAGGLALIVSNDCAAAWSGPVTVTRRSFSGQVLATVVESLDLPPRGTITVPLPPQVAAPDDHASELVVAEAGGARATWFFAEDRDSVLAAEDLEATAHRTPTGYRVEVTARTLTRDLALLVDKVDPDAVVDDMLITLLPGESVVWDVASGVELDPQRLLAPTVLRSANQLVRTGEPR